MSCVSCGRECERSVHGACALEVLRSLDDAQEELEAAEKRVRQRASPTALAGLQFQIARTRERGALAKLVETVQKLDAATDEAPWARRAIEQCRFRREPFKAWVEAEKKADGILGEIARARDEAETLAAEHARLRESAEARRADLDELEL